MIKDTHLWRPPKVTKIYRKEETQKSEIFERTRNPSSLAKSHYVGANQSDYVQVKVQILKVNFEKIDGASQTEFAHLARYLVGAILSWRLPTPKIALLQESNICDAACSFAPRQHATLNGHSFLNSSFESSVVPPSPGHLNQWVICSVLTKYTLVLTSFVKQLVDKIIQFSC